MADISRLSRLIGGFQRHVDLQQNSLVVGSLKVGSASPTELTKALLDSLLAIRTDLASNANGLGASLIGIEDAATQYTATNVESALTEVMDAAQAAQADATQALIAASAAQDDAYFANLAAEAAQTTANAAIPIAQKGTNNGVATLDAGGKVPVSQLPNAVMTYEGVWNASTNSPTLADGVGDAGMVYRVGTAGSQDLGSGSISFEVGDYIIYNGSVWEKSDTTDAVASVNGLTGVVVLDTDDIDEGSTNLYHTTTRARTAAVVNSTAGNETDQAASVDAMKAYVAAQVATKDEADEIAYDNASSGLAATDVQAAIDEVEARVDALETAPDSDPSREEFVLGEALPSAGLHAVRLMKAADASFTAGRIMRADYDASSVDNFHAIGLVLAAGTEVADDAVTVYKMGPMTATAHGFTVGEPIWLTASGALSNTAPSSANQASVLVGYARTANLIEVKIQIMGVN